MAQERRPKAPKRSASKKTSSPAPPSTPEVSHTAGPSVDFKLRGAKEHYEAPSFLSTTEVKLSIKAEFSPGLARADRPTKEVSVTADDLIEIEFENG